MFALSIVTWIRGSLIVIAGALPASALLYLALFPLAGAFSVFVEHTASALAVIAWFILAATGTVSLWLSSFLTVGPRLAAGLFSGVLAIGPFALYALLNPIETLDDGGIIVLFIAGPTVVALTLIILFVRHRIIASRSSDQSADLAAKTRGAKS